MMNETLVRKVHLLPDELINKIAAGEIIERPASVVRELLDNALDADAQKIDVTAAYGGKKLIIVSDNGCGMTQYDAELALERHSTSKIKTDHDLFTITTLGFRGEALASIRSVSKLILTTAEKDSLTGTRIDMTGSSKVIRHAPPIQGTTVEVRDLFYNIPARRKFLKTTPTEFSHIADAVFQRALAFPSVGFTLVHDDRTVINTLTGDTQESRLAQLYGAHFSDDFVKITHEHLGISIEGFVCHPQKAQKSKRQQYVFINRRPVKDPAIAHAAAFAYKELLADRKYPAYYLFIDIPPHQIDVNVHPAKLEVRFEDPSLIHRTVSSSIKKAFRKVHILPPSPEANEKKQEPPPLQSTPSDNNSSSEEQEYMKESDNSSNSFSQHTPLSSFYIGGAFAALRQQEGGLILVDQHAAHERVLYEKFLKKIAIESQALLFPAVIELPPLEFSLIIHYSDELKKVGIDVEDFGNTSVAVRALPYEFAKTDIKQLLMEIASGIEEVEGIEKDKTSLHKAIAARLACHNAVRGAENLSQKELTHLYAELNKTDEPDRCPHGRPTMIHFTLNDLKKLFKR